VSNPFVLDAWALMAFFQREEPAAKRVRELFLLAQTGGVQIFVSIINVGEVYYRLGKVNGRSVAEEALHDLSLLPVQVFPAEDDFVLMAARWKMAHRISYADAFATALAAKTNGILLTGDPELIALKGKFSIEPLARE
jgi:uncharacterized protein